MLSFTVLPRDILMDSRCRFVEMKRRTIFEVDEVFCGSLGRDAGQSRRRGGGVRRTGTGAVAICIENSIRSTVRFFARNCGSYTSSIGGMTT